MLRVYTHSRWPVLEAHVVERALAAPRPVVVVVPSSRIARRVQTALAEASPGGAVLGVRVIDLFRLALWIAGPGGELVTDSGFFVALVEHLVGLKPGRFPLIEPTIRFRGLSRALWGCISELREAGLRTEKANEFLEEKGFDDPPPAYADEVLRLANAVDLFLETQGIDDRASVVRRAIERVRERRAVLPPRLLYYGFYELIGLQTELLEALSQTVDVDVFACAEPKSRALAFANRYYKLHLAKARVETLPDREFCAAVGDAARWLFDYDTAPTGTAPPTIWSASGAFDEVWAVARRILAFHDEGVPFHEIGVVAPALDSYAEVLPPVFEASRIPYETTCGAPLLHLPYPRAVLRLVRSARGDLPRDDVTTLLRSPCRALPAGANPDTWDLLARCAGVRSGLASWETRLARWTREDLRASDRDDHASLLVPKEQARMLLDEVRALAQAIDALPTKGKWERHARAFTALIEKHLVTPEGAEDARLAVLQVIEALARRDLFSDAVNRETFLEALDEELSDGVVPLGREGSLGVRVLDLMSARAIPFRVLFVLGMNEKSFPRLPEEDPFLRDRHRERLAEVLGIALGPRMTLRVEEERTLLAWLLDAARERLFLVYQRSDEEGRLAVPSTFLHEVRRVTGAREEHRGAFEDHGCEWRVPRLWAEKVGGVPLAVLTPREAAAREAFAGREARGLYAALGWDLGVYDATRRAAKAIEGFGAAGPRDGVLGEDSPIVARLTETGLSPTGLEVLAMCPFRFLVQRALGLEPLPEAEEEVDRLVLGKVYHRALEKYFAEDLKAGRRLPTDPERLEESVKEAFAEVEATAPTGLPFLWELTRRRAVRNLLHFLEKDAVEGQGFHPARLEHRVEGKMALKLRVEIHGTVDRVDVRDDGKSPSFRIIDYKSGKQPRESLECLALKGQKLQLPLYLWLAAREFDNRVGEAMLAFVGDEGADKPFRKLDAKFWKENGERFREVLNGLLTRIKRGRFVIRPGQHCTWCPYSFICRRWHAPTLIRAEREEE